MSRASEAVLLKDHLKELCGCRPCGEITLSVLAKRGKRGPANETFLLDLVSRQLEQRRANQLERRLKEARFPVMKTLEKTDLALWPTLDGVEVRELTQCTWISKRENVALIGKHGTGKTHAATIAGSGGLPAWSPGWILQCFEPGQYPGGGPRGKAAGASVSKAQSLSPDHPPMSSATFPSHKKERSCCTKSFPIATRRLRCW